MRRLSWFASGLAALAVAAGAAMTTPAAAEGPEDLNGVRARYEGMSKIQAVQAGYAPDTVCVGGPGGMAGWHAEKYPFYEDNAIDAGNPEGLLLDESGKVVGVEYETHDVSGAAPTLFGYRFERDGDHAGEHGAHYALHIHFLPNGGYHIGEFNPNRRCPASPQAKVTAEATVTLKDAAGKTIGMGSLSEDPSGYVLLDFELSGVRPGAHGFHVHATGKCEGPAFVSAGAHFNPMSRQHGIRNPVGAHAGDLPSLVAHSDGTAHGSFASTHFTLSAGPSSLFDPDGSALMLHADDDDHMTDATGNAGARIACGVIERASMMAAPAPATPAGLPRTGDPLSFGAPLALLAGLAAGAVGVALRRRRA